MHESKRTPRLGALRSPADPLDRFSLATAMGRHNPHSGALLADGVEWGGRS